LKESLQRVFYRKSENAGWFLSRTYSTIRSTVPTVGRWKKNAMVLISARFSRDQIPRRKNDK